MNNVREKWKECRKTLTLDNRFIILLVNKFYCAG